MNKEIKDVFNAIINVVGSETPFLPLHEPFFTKKEESYVLECIKSTFVSSVGKFVDQFEGQLQEYTGVKHAVATMNGTAALQLAMQLVGVKENDEVIVPSLSFVATANAVKYNGAIPHFVDISKATLSICPNSLCEWLLHVSERRGNVLVNKTTNRRISALVVMHCFGHIGNIEEIQKVSKDFGLPLIEDAAEALGRFYKGLHACNFGKVSALSFNGNKIATTGGGGAILTNCDQIAGLAKHLTTTAKIKHPWKYVHDRVGYNYRMPNINAALGCAQLEKIDKFVETKRKLFHRYKLAFENVRNVQILAEPKGSKSNYWLQALVLNNELVKHRDEILNYTNEHGVMTRPCWEPLHNLVPFKNCPSAPLGSTEMIAKKIINLPSSVSL